MSDCGCNNFPAGLGNVNFGANVGINSANPGTKLHVRTGSCGSQPGWDASADVAIFEAPTGNNTSVQIFSNVNDSGQLVFSDNVSRYRGVIAYNHPLDQMTFKTAGNNARMTIKSSGEVGIGTTTPTEMLEVAGNIKASDGLYVGGYKIAGTAGCLYA